MCPNCKVLIYKEEGCNHMICPCGCEFCWVCGGGWKRRHHLCELEKRIGRVGKWVCWGVVGGVVVGIVVGLALGLTR